MEASRRPVVMLKTAARYTTSLQHGVDGRASTWTREPLQAIFRVKAKTVETDTTSPTLHFLLHAPTIKQQCLTRSPRLTTMRVQPGQWQGYQQHHEFMRPWIMPTPTHTTSSLHPSTCHAWRRSEAATTTTMCSLIGCIR